MIDFVCVILDVNNSEYLYNKKSELQEHKFVAFRINVAVWQ